MAIKIVISDTVGFKVKGTINDEKGIAQPFDFTLICSRLDQDQIQAKLKDNGDASLTDFLADVIESWNGVRDASDAQLPYSEASLRACARSPAWPAWRFAPTCPRWGQKKKTSRAR